MPGYICPLDADTNAYLTAFCDRSFTYISAIRFKDDLFDLKPADVAFIDKSGTHADGTERDNTEIYTCAHLYNQPVVVHSFVADQLPFTLYATGQLSAKDCFLIPAPDAPGRYLNCEKTKTSSVASCWMEERPNRISHTEWSRLLCTLRKLVACADRIRDGLRHDTSKLYAVDPEDGTVKLRLEWMPKPTQTEVRIPVSF